MFGELKEGIYKPFYTYSIEQSLKDGYILDVMKDYTCIAFDIQIRPNLKSQQSTEPTELEDILHSSGERQVYVKSGPSAVRKVVREANNSPELIKLKSEHIVTHFLGIIEKHQHNTFTPKAMVVTSSRRAVLLYTQLISQFVSTLPTEKVRKHDASLFPSSNTQVSSNLR